MQGPLLIVAIVVLAVFCGRMMSQIVPHRRPFQSPLQSILDRIAWVTPVARDIQRSRAMADVCQVLADALAGGQPLDLALAEASRTCPNAILAHRTGVWSMKVSSGTPLVDAAREARMPRLLVGMLSPAQSAAAIGDVFTFLARYYDSRFNAAAAILQGAAIPIMVGVMAVFVTILALGLFMPLIALTNHLAGGKGVL